MSLDGEHFTPFTPADGPPMAVSTLCEDREGRVWIGAEGSVATMAKGSRPPAEVCPRSSRLFRPRMARWFGTEGGGGLF